jgi:hypothetical protein
MEVGFVGLGDMGLAMTDNLRRAGRERPGGAGLDGPIANPEGAR